MDDNKVRLSHALWRIYRRPELPAMWTGGGNLPWNDPDFSRRMLREHLDETHGAASRQSHERLQIVDWLWTKLGLSEGMHLLDVTCGPGFYAVEFARRGCTVTGVDFSPASVAYARELSKSAGMSERCTFIEADVRQLGDWGGQYDAALLIYGQMAVFPRAEAQALLHHINLALRPGGKLAIELLDREHVNKNDSNWWFTDDTGLWGNAPFLHLGERFWDEEKAVSTERFHIIQMETGHMDTIVLCDQTYTSEMITISLLKAGFSTVAVYPAWDGLPLYDAEQWVVYIAQTSR